MLVNIDDEQVAEIEKMGEMLTDPDVHMDQVRAIAVDIAAKMLGTLRFELIQQSHKLEG